MLLSDDRPEASIYIWLQLDNLSWTEHSFQWENRWPKFLILLLIFIVSRCYRSYKKKKKSSGLAPFAFLLPFPWSVLGTFQALPQPFDLLIVAHLDIYSGAYLIIEIPGSRHASVRNVKGCISCMLPLPKLKGVLLELYYQIGLGAADTRWLCHLNEKKKKYVAGFCKEQKSVGCGFGYKRSTFMGHVKVWNRSLHWRLARQIKKAQSSRLTLIPLASLNQTI